MYLGAEGFESENVYLLDECFDSENDWLTYTQYILRTYSYCVSASVGPIPLVRSRAQTQTVASALQPLVHLALAVPLRVWFHELKRVVGLRSFLRRSVRSVLFGPWSVEYSVAQSNSWYSSL